MLSDETWLFQRSQDILEDGLWSPQDDEPLEVTYETAKGIELWYELFDNVKYRHRVFWAKQRVALGLISDVSEDMNLQEFLRFQEDIIFEQARFNATD